MGQTHVLKMAYFVVPTERAATSLVIAIELRAILVL